MFNQAPPQLANQYLHDRVLRSLLQRQIPTAMLHELETSLTVMGELAAHELYQLQLVDRLHEPQLIQWDAWGNRIDQIIVSPLWERAQELAARYGIVGAAYQPELGPLARIYQFAMAYLFHPSTDVYSCPLAMTDGAARTLLSSGNQVLIERAVPRLTSCNPQTFWTSGQWMTESIGGSDVGNSETIARQDADGTWRLYGRKWFTSATTSEMALTLARPEGNPAGGRGLALFYVETRDQHGRLRNIEVNRLKDKLGTRKVPTAELMLVGAPAIPVAGLTNGVTQIIPMLQITRTWNSVMASSFMRRGLALAVDYAQRRKAFGRTLSEQPLHIDTLATQQAEFEAAFHLSFYLVQLLGLIEHEQATPEQVDIFRILTSLTKLLTGRQAVDVLSEVIEAFGGAGYVEDTGLPLLLRDAHVLPIWEGTTNVLALDTLRAIQRGEGIASLGQHITSQVQMLNEPSLHQAGSIAQQAWEAALKWLEQTQTDGDRLQAGMRRFALTVARSVALVQLLEQAQWSLEQHNDPRPAAAARRFAQSTINLINPKLDWADAQLMFADSLPISEEEPA